MKQIVVDMDNTMGVAGCDVDDALALLYLLGKPDACVVRGICTTYGNSTIETVHANTMRLASEWGLDTPVYRGAASSDDDAHTSEAARYLAQIVEENPGQISVLATGSLTNLKHAAVLNPLFFEQVREIVLMGGIESTLLITGDLIMDELNFSCDAQATQRVLSEGEKVSVATANRCLPAFFTERMMRARFGENSWLCDTCSYWFGQMNEQFNWHGWTCWDVVAAAILLQPELFVDDMLAVTLNTTLLSVGYLEKAPLAAPQARIHVPIIKDADAFCQTVLDAWAAGLQRVGKN